jgi:glycosyltransferase involved in cell wall biosynthesis
MKITIISTFDTFGGASISGLRLHQAFLKNGVESSMLVQEKKSNLTTIKTVSSNWFKAKMSFLRFAFDRLQFWFYEKSKEVRFVFSTALIGIDISEHKVVKEAEILHLFWINFGFLSLDSIKKLGEANKPIIWNLQDMWAFTGGCHYSGDCLAYEKSCGNCKQFLRNPDENDLSRNTWERKLEKFRDLNLTIVSSSDWLAQKARQSSLFKDLEVITIPTPIDVEIFRPTPKDIAATSFQLSPNKKYILFAAVKISDKRKGFLYFKEALSMLDARLSNFENSTPNIEHRTEASVASNIEILIFGQAQLSDFEGLPFKVNILGKLSDLPTIAKAYSAASVFVIPSLEDNLPNTVIESMACGTPVVGFNTGGIPEMIDHNITGYVADYKSSEDLAKGIYWTLFESDYQALVDNSRQKVLDNYSEEVIVERYKKLYQSLFK